MQVVMVEVVPAFAGVGDFVSQQVVFGLAGVRVQPPVGAQDFHRLHCQSTNLPIDPNDSGSIARHQRAQEQGISPQVHQVGWFGAVILVGTAAGVFTDRPQVVVWSAVLVVRDVHVESVDMGTGRMTWRTIRRTGDGAVGLAHVAEAQGIPVATAPALRLAIHERSRPFDEHLKVASRVTSVLVCPRFSIERVVYVASAFHRFEREYLATMRGTAGTIFLRQVVACGSGASSGTACQVGYTEAAGGVADHATAARAGAARWVHAETIRSTDLVGATAGVGACGHADAALAAVPIGTRGVLPTSRPAEGACAPLERAAHVSFGVPAIGCGRTAGNARAATALVDGLTRGTCGARCIGGAPVDQAIAVDEARHFAIECVGIALRPRILAVRIRLAGAAHGAGA